MRRSVPAPRKEPQTLKTFLRLGGIGIGAAVIVGLVWPFFGVERRAGAMVRDALPGYSCGPLYLQPTSGRTSFSGDFAYSSGSLPITRTCLSDFEAQVRSGGHFTPETCDLSRTCWGTTKGRAHLVLDIRPDSVSYRFTEAGAP